INGNLSIYQFQSKADGVTPTLLNPLDPTNPDEMPLGHYYISCYGIDADGNRSDPAWKEFVVGGKLANPQFSYSVEDGKMTVSITSSYINNAIRTEGLPYSIDVEIDDGSGSKKTVVFDNWAYYTTVIGPETSFNFMFLTKEIDVATADNYVVSAIARGDGGDIKDSDKVTLAPYKTSSDVPSDWFAQGASTVDLTATTSDGMTVTMKVDKDNGKWSVVGGSSNKYYGSTWGTMTESEGTYTLTTVGGGDYATVSSFAVTELNDEGKIKKANASITVASTSRLNSSLEDVPATVTASYEERSQGGWPGGPGGPGGPPPGM
ncbi:MAG: hypothetical protein IJX05_06090, partial [Clostridia bacterium]|nr:hypothetical protein [Clostridia bacterium]